MRFVLLLAFLSYSLCSFSQQLHIYYDAITDSVRYVQDGKEVINPTIKKGKKIELHVINYNDYLYDLSIKIEQEEIKIPSGGLGSMMKVNGGGDALNNLMNSTKSLDGNGFNKDGIEWTEDVEEGNKGLGFGSQAVAPEAEKNFAKVVTQYATTLERMQDKEIEVNEQAVAIQSKLNVFKVKQFMGQEIVELKYNPRLNPEQIKRLSLEYLEQVFGVTDPAELDLNEVIEKADIQKTIQKDISLYRAKVNNLNKLLLVLELAKDSIIKFPFAEEEYRLSLLASFDQAKSRTDAYTNKIQEMESNSTSLENWDLKELLSVRYTYEELKNHSFTYNYPFTPTSDEVKLAITLTPNEAGLQKNVKTRELAPLEFPVYGGVKVNASVGISFGGYLSRPQTYFSRDSEILADDGDLFQPIITSFIHFYRQSQSAVSFGGSFGLGISLGGGGTGSQTYFLGPSLIFGKGQRVVMTTGIMGGKVDRLARGYELGDFFDETIVPTRSVYDLGYFLGFSFNLGK